MSDTQIRIYLIGSCDGFGPLRDQLADHPELDLVANLGVAATPGGHATRIILRDLTVLQAAGAAPTGPVNQQQSVILEVTDNQVQRLFYVMKNAEWTLELRPPVDASDTSGRTDTLQSVLESGGIR